MVTDTTLSPHNQFSISDKIKAINDIMSKTSLGMI